jgi:hypothetical protein
MSVTRDIIIIQEQHALRAQHQGTIENKHSGHCIHLSEITNVRGEIALQVPQIVATEQLQRYES